MPVPPWKSVARIAAAALFALSGWSAAAAPPLPALNVDIHQTSVSGISSGGFMSVQFEVAYSSIVMGAGIVAGGPYYCSRDAVYNAVAKCSCTGEPSVPCAVSATSTDVPALVSAARDMHREGLIDDPALVSKQRVITFSGAKDSLVPPLVADQLSDFYAALGLGSSGFSAVRLSDAAHTMPTVDYGIACDKEAEPYIGKCDYDSAKAILSWIYGPLQAPAAKPTGHFIQFDQAAYVPSDEGSAFLWSTGLDATGWVYVPESCAKGEPCRLHVALHGCKQGQSYLPLKPPPGGGLYYGTTFVKHAGYDRWADNNHIVVLYPQAVSIPLVNPNGCWDWWGYTGPDYADQRGVQLRTLKAMVDRLSSGAH